MKKVKFDNPHRIKHFEFFSKMNHPHFSVTIEIDINNFLSYVKDKNLKFTPAIVYAISTAVNKVKEFKWRIRGDEIVEHEVVHPSFTVNTAASSVFSFCTVTYVNNINTFVEQAEMKMAEMESDPSFEDEPGRDDYLFLSALPWFSFTGFQNAMQLHPSDSVPRIVWGKYYEQDNKIKMPLSIQVHHALVNGKEVSDFIQHLEGLLKNCNF